MKILKLKQLEDAGADYFYFVAEQIVTLAAKGKDMPTTVIWTTNGTAFEVAETVEDVLALLQGPKKAIRVLSDPM